MTTINSYGIGALALIAMVFYLIRKIPWYAILCSAIIVGFAVSTIKLVDWKQPSEWIIMTSGLLLCSFGLLIVRVMLIRSVSLNLLARIEQDSPGGMEEDIGGRLKDMRFFHLIRTTKTSNELTAFGRLISVIVVIFYSVFRINR